MLVKNKKDVFFVIVSLVAILFLLYFLMVKGTFSVVVNDSDYKIHFVSINRDAIVVESNGHYGLIDTGFSSSNYCDMPYELYDERNCDSKNNALTIINYLKDIGVMHLDFVIMTHNHLDHIGGVYELCESNLVDNSTTFIYKEYKELIGNSESSFGNMYYYNRAITAIKNKDAIMQDTISLSEKNGEFKGVLANASLKNGENDVSDYIEFNFHGSNIKIYNLHHESSMDENTNSLVQLITMDGKKFLSMGDINDEFIEESLSETIGDVDLLKLGDDGKMKGNKYVKVAVNVKFIKAVSPSVVVNFHELSSDKNYAIPYTYYQQNNISAYESYSGNNSSRNSIVAYISNDGISMYTYERQNQYIDEATPILYGYKDGWYEDANYNKFYIKNGGFVAAGKDANSGWLLDNGKWYYFDSDGIMQTGWKEIYSSDDKIHWYYLNYNGEMLTGWQELLWKGQLGKYYFDEKGRMQEGWFEYKNRTYYLLDDDSGNDGVLITGVYKIDDKLYYFDKTDGYRVERGEIGGLEFLSGNYYYFNEDHTLKTGWHYDDEFENAEMYFDPDTGAAIKEGYATLEDEGGITKNYFYDFHAIIQLKSTQKFTLDEDYITNIKVGTNVNKILQNVNDLQFKEHFVVRSVVLDKSGNEKTRDSIVTTGDKLVIFIGTDIIFEFTLCVDGDIDGDGKITNSDLSLLAKHILKSKELDAESLRASDVDDNGTVNINDVIKITRTVIQDWAS